LPEFEKRTQPKEVSFFTLPSTSTMAEESIFDLGNTHVGGFLGKGWENVKR
jgi:hypothetical protein